MMRTPSERIDPTAKGAPDIVRAAAQNGFTVRYHPDRDGYQFRHHLGKVKFFTPELHYVTDRDIAVFN
jgi:hypothetical protein